MPTITNEVRQSVSVINSATTGGATALPNREKEWVMPWTMPRWPTGIQLMIARADAGRAAPSPTPSAMRTANRDARLPTKPVAIVVTTQIATQPIRVQRGPNLSAITPPMTWVTR